MADNTTLNPGTGGDVIATDDIGGVKYQIIKNAFGVADAVVPVAAGAGLPIAPQIGTAIDGTLTNVSDIVLVPCDGATAVIFHILATSLTGATISALGSMDGGSSYAQISVQSGAQLATGVTFTNAVSIQIVNCAGLTHVKMTLTATTGGTATIKARPVYGVTPAVYAMGGSISTILAGVIPGTSSTSLGKAEDGAHTSGDVGVFMLGVRNDNDATFSSTDLDYTPVNVDGTGRVRTITRVSSSTVGNTHSIVSANTTNATSVKATAGNVYVISCSNLNAAVRYLKMYNKASAPTVGTDTPLFRFAIPPNSAGFNVTFPNPLPFSTGIAYALTTGITDADATAVAASEILINLLYA